MTKRKARPGGRPPTIHEVADAAGVSIGTVSRVAGDSPRVAAETRSRVRAAMAELGYQPNAAARAMRTNTTKTIGFLIPDMTNNVFGRVLTGAEALLAPAGYMVFAFSSNHSPERESAFLQAVRQRQMDGLIVALADEAAVATIAELKRIDVPIVILDREVPIDADVVYSEHKAALDTIVRHLAVLGHRRMGLITASQKIRPGRDRVDGYRRALLAAGLDVDERLIRAERQNMEYGASETHDMLTAPDAPTALIAAGNDICRGALRAIRLLGLRIPDDVSFVGADEPYLADLADPPLTMIDRDMVEVGAVAAQVLLDRLREKNLPPRRVLLPSSVVMRRSLGPPKAR